jgi:large subunit ribosomal protein L25
MKIFELKGAKRESTGKKAAKAYRKESLVPCVLYGGGEVVHFTVTKDGIRKLIYTPEVYTVDLTIEGKNYAAILKDTQYHPVSDELIHADFLQIFKDKPVVIEIPIVLEGLAQGVKEGGKLSMEMRKLKVKGLYKDFPEKLVVNIENLGLGKTIQVGNLSFKNLELLNVKENVVASVKTTRAVKGATETPGTTTAATPGTTPPAKE